MAWLSESTIYVANIFQPATIFEVPLGFPEGFRTNMPQLFLAFTPDDSQLILGGFPAPDGNNGVMVIDVPGSG